MEKEQERAILTELESSGLTVAEYSRSHGLSADRLYSLKRRVARQEPAGKFVRIAPKVSVTVQVSEGVKIEVPIESLKEVLEILGVRR